MWDLEKFASSIAFRDDFGKSGTYADLIAFSELLGKVAPARSLVFSFCENTSGSLLGYVGFIRNRIVPLLLDANMDRELVNRLIAIYQPGFLWLPAAIKDKFSGKPVLESNDYVLLQCGESPELHPDLALLVLTSGSTGSPKLVRQSYSNLLSNAESIAEYLELDETERPITTLPMSYVYGLSIINSHFLTGARLLLCRNTIAQRDFWNFFDEMGATSFGGVPYTYEMLVKLRFLEKDRASLRTMTQAGGKLHPETHKKFAKYADKYNKKFVVMYGQSEATARMGWLPPDMAIEKCGCMGLPIPGGKFTLIDEVGKEISRPFQMGELIYEGSNVTLGYAEKQSDLLLGDERGGRLETGDIAHFDEDGIYSIVGRKKRFLKVFGNRVSLDELERILQSHVKGLECACCGKDDNVRIFITPPHSAEDVREFISAKTKLHPSAFTVKVIEELPKNEAGKPLYSVMEKMDV